MIVCVGVPLPVVKFVADTVAVQEGIPPLESDTVTVPIEALIVPPRAPLPRSTEPGTVIVSGSARRGTSALPESVLSPRASASAAASARARRSAAGSTAGAAIDAASAAVTIAPTCRMYGLPRRRTVVPPPRGRSRL
ncbi:hypothetical protein [Microbispora sp. GKU 823]|uniref:hypothetical protein n=1 Tax=Microbispora sp. GKU 823 TaxID=1652100 RepID=UPI0009A3D894|nr:hypothetical protein [Microbispora sp. GKU 823]OPG09135.1 hypothetical protein B1L11_26755 [Microbispora sp. GKU 823]